MVRDTGPFQVAVVYLEYKRIQIHQKWQRRSTFVSPKERRELFHHLSEGHDNLLLVIKVR
jgi:hypothetical protein